MTKPIKLTSAWRPTFTPEFWALVSDLKEQKDFIDAAALAQVERNRQAKVRPQVAYRCEHGCGLFEAWKYPKGIIMWHPALRISTRRLSGQSFPGGDVWSRPGARLPELDHARDFVPGALVVPARAHLWNESSGALIACEHTYGHLSHDFGEVLEAEVTASLANGGKTRRVIARVSEPDIDGHVR